VPEHTLFFRLLAHDDKAAALAERVAATGTGTSLDPAVHVVDPASFRRVPSSPFAYWASERIQQLFTELPAFESDGRMVRVGLQTSDDFRFVRTWWEVASDRVLDAANAPPGDIATFQAWCKQQTFRGKRWVPLAKGGEHSPYYTELYSVVNWQQDGREMKRWASQVYDGAHWSRNLRSVEHYFRPGLTWPLRGIHLSVQAVPAGSIFSIAGKIAIVDQTTQLPSILGIMNSRCFDFFVGLFAGKVGGVQYESGLISRIPLPLDLDLEKLICLSEDAYIIAATTACYDERSRLFHTPILVQTDGEPLKERFVDLQAAAVEAEKELASVRIELDEIAYGLYGISSEDRGSIEAFFDRTTVTLTNLDEDETTHDEEREAQVRASVADHRALVADLVSYAVGCAFGRWDVRFATGELPEPELPDPFAPLPVCSPGMLQGAEGLPLPETPEGYPLRIGWDGILVDDLGHADDIVRRVREVLELVWGERAEGIEREACEILGVRELREYFRNPGGFFADHVKRYSKSRRKAPIYWLLQSPKRSYGLWLYYHRLDRDTVFVALRHYVEPKINGEVTRLREMNADLEAKRATLARREQTQREKAIDRQEGLIAELGAFKAALERVANLGYDPDLDDGVVLNAAPFREVMPWREAKAYWDDLLAGKYAWSTISRRLRARGVIR
jgi:hypothetical protein